MRPAIKVENLWKKYRIGGKFGVHNSLKEAMTSALMAPTRLARRVIHRIPPPPREIRNEIWALKDVSFEVFPGEIVGIIGRNGAGKSTLFRVLSRITAPTRGRFQLAGSLSSLLEVGAGMNPYLTGRENIFLAGSVFGMKIRDIRRQFDAIVAYSEVEGFLDTPIKNYSSGMYVRLAFAVAAHLNPDILLVDEILAVGDNAFHKKCLSTLKEGAGRDRAVLFVSHSMQIIRQLCTRVIHIEGGSVMMDSPTEIGITAYNRYLQKPRDISDEGRQNRLDRSTGAVHIRSFRGRESDGEECWRFRHGDNVHFDLDYSVVKPVPSLALTLTLRSVTSGEIISTIREALSDKPLKAGAELSARLKLPQIPLRPGDYALTVQLGDVERSRVFDVIDENIGMPWLSIDLSPANPFANEGYVSLPAEITAA